MTAVSAVVQGVPSRQHLQPRLLGDIADQCGNAKVYLDTEYKGSIFGFRKAVETSLTHPSRWCLVVDDDITLCQNAIPLALEIGNRASDHHAGVSLFMPPRDHPESRYRSGYCAVSELALWGQGLLLKREVAEKYLANGSSYKGRCKDNHFIQFLAVHDLRILTALPSLCQHNLETESTLGHPVEQFGRVRNTAATCEELDDPWRWYRNGPICDRMPKPMCRV